LDDDGLALDEVGSWVKEKHERLRKYVDISGKRKKKTGRLLDGRIYNGYPGGVRNIILDTRRAAPYFPAHGLLPVIKPSP
jgi:hypothetical protein